MASGSSTTAIILCRCGKPAVTRCSGCKFYRYCSEPCQRLDWPDHKYTCQSALFKVLVPVWNQHEKMVPKVDDKGRIHVVCRGNIDAGDVVLLQSTRALASPKPTEIKQLRSRWNKYREQYEPIFHVLKHEITNPPAFARPHDNKIMFHDLIIKKFGFHVQIGITKDKKPIERIAFNTGVAMMNHDCQPNCHIVPILGTNVDEVIAFRVVALRDIKPGDEITIAYHTTCTMSPYMTRKENLQRVLGISDCPCVLCREGVSGPVEDARNKLDAAVLDIFTHLRRGCITLSGGFSSDVLKAFEDLEKHCDVMYPPDKYKYNLARINMDILRLKLANEYGIVEKELLKDTILKISILQGENSSEYRNLIEMREKWEVKADIDWTKMFGDAPFDMNIIANKLAEFKH